MCVEINEATMDFSTAHGVTQNLEKENCKQSKRQDGNLGDADKNVVRIMMMSWELFAHMTFNSFNIQFRSRA